MYIKHTVLLFTAYETAALHSVELGLGALGGSVS